MSAGKYSECFAELTPSIFNNHTGERARDTQRRVLCYYRTCWKYTVRYLSFYWGPVNKRGKKKREGIFTSTSITEHSSVRVEKKVGVVQFSLRVCKKKPHTLGNGGRMPLLFADCGL